MSGPPRVALVLLTAAVVQRGIFSQLRMDGAALDLLMLMAIAAGIVGGAERGAVIGFFAGLLFDLMVQAPFGLFALSYCLVGYVVGSAHGTVVRESRWEPMGLAALGSALGVGMYAFGSFMVGRAGLIDGHLVTVIAVVAVSNALLVPAADRVLGWAIGDLGPSRAAAR